MQHSVVFGQLVQKLEQTTSNTFALQDDQNEWSQCSILTASLKVGINFGFTASAGHWDYVFLQKC